MTFRSLTFLCILTIGAGCTRGPSSKTAEPETKPGPVAKETSHEKEPTDPLALDPAILKRCKEATVLIGNFEGGELTATGSGFVTGDGMIVITNKHVVVGRDNKPDACKLVFYSGTEKPKLVQVNPEAISIFPGPKADDPKYFETDVAMIRLPGKTADPVDLGSADDETETSPTWAFGFPAGTNIRMSATKLPSPTVHAMRIERIEKAKDKVRVIQLGGSPTFGDSGGMVINRKGEVIGVMQAKGGESIVYAVPARVAKDLIARRTTEGDIAALWAEPIGGKPVVRETHPDRDPSQRPVLTGRSGLSAGLVTTTDLENLSAKELTILRNEPFARRGYIFKRPELRAAFSNASWYSPRTRDLSAIQRTQSRTETRNIDFIKSYQAATSRDY